MSVRTTTGFKRLPVGKCCSVYFHAIDVVLDRADVVRQAWRSSVHLPRGMFHPSKGRRGSRAAVKMQNYCCFKRMLAVKAVVYANHQNMFRLYEKYCEEAETEMYWGDDDDEDDTMALDALPPPEDTEEQDCEDEF